MKSFVINTAIRAIELSFRPACAVGDATNQSWNGGNQI